MINIGKPYLKEDEYQVKLCADIHVNGSLKTLWFGIALDQRNMIVTDRADSFVIVLMFLAERLGQDIVSEALVSRKLLYELRHYVIPVVFDVDDYIRNIPLRMGFVFSNDASLYREATEFIKNNGVAIPERAYTEFKAKIIYKAGCK